MNEFIKLLTKNDTGETGSGQEGITIPKNPGLLKYFPKLDKTKKNPRRNIQFIDDKHNFWDCSFVYYNNKYFNGTRDEYRLSGTKSFIKNYNLRANDKIIFSRDLNGRRKINYEKSINTNNIENIIRISSNWKERRVRL